MRNFLIKSLTYSDLDHYTRRLTRSYFLAMAIVGALAVALFAVLLAQINSQGRYATLIGFSARQRMLVQRAALFSLRLTQEPDSQRRAEFCAIITRAVTDLERIQRGLIQGDAALELSGHPGGEIEALSLSPPTALDQRIEDFARTERLLTTQAGNAPLDPRSPELAKVLAAVPGELLAALDTVAAAYERANHRATRELQVVESVLVLLLLLALFAELRYIFRPLVRAILRETRIESETRRRYDAVLNTVGEAIVTVDAGNIVLSANAEAEVVWGRPVAEFIGQPINALVLPGRDLSPAEWRAMFPPGSRTESIGLRHGGESFPLELRLTATTLDDGGDGRSAEDGAGTSFFTLSARDISDRVEAEGQVAAARDAALDAARARGEFVANISHELRTPMNGVLGATDLLEATGLNAEQHELLDTIRTSGDSLLAIINDTLDFSKMEAGKMSLEAIELDLRHLVESTADVLAGRALQKTARTRSFTSSRARPPSSSETPRACDRCSSTCWATPSSSRRAGESRPARPLRPRGRQAPPRSGFPSTTPVNGHRPRPRSERLFRAFSQADGSTARHFGGHGTWG